MKKILKKSAVIIYILALGVLVGLTILQQPSKQAPVSKENSQSELNTTPVSTPQEDQPGDMAVETGHIRNNTDTEVNKDNVIVPKNENALTGTGNKNNQPNAEENKNAAENNSQKTISNAEEKQTANQTTKEKTEAKAEIVDIMEMVSVKTNDYKRGAFGGIKNLQLTVTNESQYLLDKVKVEIQYLKPSEEPLITETVEFTSVAPKGTLTIRIPDNNRGIKVLCRVMSVKSSQYENVVAGL